jgi:hypothetical protein
MNKINITNSKKPNGTFANSRYVGGIVLILSLLLTSPFAVLYAQTENETDISAEITETEQDNRYSTKLREISENEYTIRKNESEHLRHKPYKVITNFEEAQKMLGEKMKIIEVEVGEEKYIEIELTFKDKTKRRFANGFRAYFPELNILLWEAEATGDWQIDLNDSREDAKMGNPYNHAISPDKKLRINGYYIGGASEGSEYWLEKWNPKKKKYEFFDSFEGFIFYLSHDWFWTSNSTVLFRYGWHESAKYYEMEISEK